MSLEDRTGKVYRIKVSDNAKVLSWHMAGRLRDGDLLLCLTRGPGTTHQFLPLWYDLTELKPYPSVMAFMAEPIGEEIEVPNLVTLMAHVTRPAQILHANEFPELLLNVGSQKPRYDHAEGTNTTT